MFFLLEVWRTLYKYNICIILIKNYIDTYTLFYTLETLGILEEKIPIATIKLMFELRLRTLNLYYHNKECREVRLHTYVSYTISAL